MPAPDSSTTDLASTDFAIVAWRQRHTLLLSLFLGSFNDVQFTKASLLSSGIVFFVLALAGYLLLRRAQRPLGHSFQTLSLD